jgi:hypothetical protein
VAYSCKLKLYSEMSIPVLLVFSLQTDMQPPVLTHNTIKIFTTYMLQGVLMCQIEPLFNVSLIKILLHLMPSFIDPKSLIMMLNFLNLRFSLV